MKRDHVHNYVLGINGTHIYLNIFWTKEMLQINWPTTKCVCLYFLFVQNQVTKILEFIIRYFKITAILSVNI